MPDFPVASVAPFVCMLLAIAFLPLAAPRLWERPWVQLALSALLGIPTVVYVLAHEPALVAHAAHEYVSFIVLLGALFTISGGIVLTGDLRATPAVNTTFLGVGAVLANVIGTTGASMVLIRPLLWTNHERRFKRHLPVFFIVVVSNVGGMLTPLGDPPLFLGYLRGVPFFWTANLAPIWVLSVVPLLAAFYVTDRRAYRRERPEHVAFDRSHVTPLALHGKRNFLFLGATVGAAFLPTPWRETTMVLAAAASVWLTPRALRSQNGFSWHPIIEVAAVFFGVFATMIPALRVLETHAEALGLSEPWHFFWATGGLSGFLDNAPTYLAFVSVARGLDGAAAPLVAGVSEPLLVAISAGAVLMGANTYIGNGPNFMVKSIAHHAGIPTPNFFEYMLRATLTMLPIYVLLTLLFFS